MKQTGFVDRLNLCLDKEGFPPKNRGRIQLLAEMVGMSHRGASKWINGESIPPQKKFSALANKLNVSEEWLRTGQETINDNAQEYKHKPYLIDVNIYDTNNFFSTKKIILKQMQCNLSHKGDFFGILLETEAMSPRFPNGSIIIFEQQEAKDGDFVLINFPTFPDPIFRQLLISHSDMYLNAHNPKFDRLVLTNRKFIIGKLVQAILSFE